MEPVRILSQEQRHTLESSYTCLRAVSTHLESIIPNLQSWDELHAKNLLNFSQLCISKLVQNFPEIEAWEVRGGGR
jgi:hypothetical protein